MPESEVFVSDTHTLVWFLTRDKKLSSLARSILLRAQDGDALVYVPTIVLSEFLYMAIGGKIPWDRMFHLVLALSEQNGFRVASLDLETFSRMMYLVLAAPHPRPSLEIHDLSILATALLLEAKLITRDSMLLKQTLVKTVWL